MERYLFYMYLDYLRENNLTFWPRLWKQPKMVIILMIVVAVSGIASVVISIFQSNQFPAVAAAIVEVIGCVALYYYVEHYMITCSKSRVSEYRDYCKKIKEWLVRCNIEEEAKIQILLERVNESIEEIEAIDKKSQERSERWLQALVIPVVLAIITTVISQSADINGMIAGTLTIIIFFIAIYSVFSAVGKVASFPNKRMHEQLSCFASDLQGVLDTQMSDSIFKSS